MSQRCRITRSQDLVEFQDEFGIKKLKVPHAVLVPPQKAAIRVRQERRDYLEERRKYFQSLSTQDVEALWMTNLHSDRQLSHDEMSVLRVVVRMKKGLDIPVPMTVWVR